MLNFLDRTAPKNNNYSLEIKQINIGMGGNQRILRANKYGWGLKLK